MRADLRRSGRIMARVTFCGLLLLAFGLLTALAGFVSYFTSIYDTCRAVWGIFLTWLSTPGVLLPGAVAGTMILMAGTALVRQWRATQRLLNSLEPYHVPLPPRLARIADEVGLGGRVDCVSGIVVAPFCYGFVQPRVCIPMALLDILDDAELRAVLRHEGHHARSLDPLKVWLTRALAQGLYFLPVAGALRDSFMAAKEVAADEIVAEMDELPLASALVKMLSAGGTTVGLAAAAPSLADGPAGGGGQGAVAGLISVAWASSGETEERIRCLIDGRPAQLKLPSLASMLFSVVIVALIFVASYTSLRAASVAPDRQECVPVHTSEEQPAVLISLGGEAVPAMPAVTGVNPVMVGAPVGAPFGSQGASDLLMIGPVDCELLTRNCLEDIRLLSQSVGGTIH